MPRLSGGSGSSGASGGSVTQGTTPWVDNITQIGGSAISLGQALATASIPVVLTAAQISTLTPPAAITNFALESGGNLASIVTSVQLLDNAISGAGFNITQFGGAAVPIGAGLEATAVRVTLPTNGTGIVGLATGTNSIGQVTANAGTNLNTSALLTSSDFAAAFGTAGTADSQVMSIQGIASMTPVQVSQATASNLNATVVGTGTFATQSAITAASGAFSSGALSSGSIASGAVSSGAVASGAFASGSIASGAIAAGAIAIGATSIADNEDVASAGADTLVKVAQIRQDTPVANAGVSNDGDYLNFRADNFGKTWVTGTVPEDTAHVAGEALTVLGSRRIATLATSSGSDADWSTVNQTAEGAAWSSLAATATPNGLLIGNFTSGDTYTALTSTAQAIKASAGNMYGYYIYNPNSSATYVLVYNIAAASVTVGSSTASLVFCIPATSAANLMFPVPIPFSNAGWSIAAATTGGGNTAPATALEAMVFYL